jgi:hypothetical protein
MAQVANSTTTKKLEFHNPKLDKTQDFVIILRQLIPVVK